MVPARYDCLGCEVCFPALAVNALDGAGLTLETVADPCPTAPVEARAGWPPLPGAYTVLRYQAPVAICTLTDEELLQQIATNAPSDVSIVGTLFTENLGIERLVLNTIANPNIRHLILCGADSRQRIGHLPGQSLVALAQSGLDDQSRIIGATGKRPVLRNISPATIDRFRSVVEVVDKIGESRLPAIESKIAECAARYPGPADPYSSETTVSAVAGYLPDRMTPDPAGYFVVHVDRRQHRLVLEHYTKEGILDLMIDGRTPAEVYCPAIERGLLTRLDHAAYLGGELTRAEAALLGDQPFRQDAAPESAARSATAGCGCATAGGSKCP